MKDEKYYPKGYVPNSPLSEFELDHLSNKQIRKFLVEENWSTCDKFVQDYYLNTAAWNFEGAKKLRAVNMIELKRVMQLVIIQRFVEGSIK